MIVSLEEWRSRSYREDTLAALLQKSNAVEMFALRRESARLGLPVPDRLPAHWGGMGPGTNFNGLETLASMQTAPGAVGPTASPGISCLSRECLEPIAPNYFRQIGNRFWVRAYGTTLSTTTITTQQLILNVGPTYANPLGGQMIAQNAAITPAGTSPVTCNWALDVLVTVRATGTSGSLIAVGWLHNNWAAADTVVPTFFANVALSTAPTAVVLTGTGGMQVPLYFDLISIQGAATAGNTCTALDYALMSLD